MNIEELESKIRIKDSYLKELDNILNQPHYTITKLKIHQMKQMVNNALKTNGDGWNLQ